MFNLIPTKTITFNFRLHKYISKSMKTNTKMIHLECNKSSPQTDRLWSKVIQPLIFVKNTSVFSLGKRICYIPIF